MADDKSIQFLATDLASGDGKALALNSRQFEVARIQSSQHPLFLSAYERLWAEFGLQNEMERREVIAQRLAWYPAAAIGDCWMRYEMFLVQKQGQFVAVRDHAAVVTRHHGSPQVVLHLSHILVDTAWRRTGISGWLRAWPIQTARACLTAAGFPAASPITLVLEMEHPDPQFEKAMIRIKAYEKAGFKKIDRRQVAYFQPDFRPPEIIDATGGPQPLPFALLVRRLGREEEQFIEGAELRMIVSALYRMYGTGCRAEHMTTLWEGLKNYPGPEAKITLVPPSQ